MAPHIELGGKELYPHKTGDYTSENALKAHILVGAGAVESADGQGGPCPKLSPVEEITMLAQAYADTFKK